MTAYIRIPAVEKRDRGALETESSVRERMELWLAQVRVVVRATFSRQVWVTLVLLGGLILSALGVIYASHLNRTLFIDLQALQKERDQYQTEWSQLLLEQSAWSALSRIEHLAVTELDMKVPNPQDIVMVK